MSAHSEWFSGATTPQGDGRTVPPENDESFVVPSCKDGVAGG